MGLLCGAGNRPGSVIATTAEATTQTVTINDSTSASGDILFKLNVNETAPVFLIFPPGLEMEFTSLSVDPAGCDVFLLTTQ